MAKWFTMPKGVESVSLGQMEFHPKVVMDGVRLMAVPDHLAGEVLALNIRTGTTPDGRPVFGRFGEVNAPGGVEAGLPEAVVPVESEALNGRIMSLEVQMEGLRAQIAELTVERDEWKLRALEAEEKTKWDEQDEGESAGIGEGNRGSKRAPKSAGKLLTDAPPAEALLGEMASMTFGKG